MSIPVAIISIIVLMLINAFFAGSEVAIVASNKALVENDINKGNKKAKIVLNYMNNSTSLFSVIQVGITFVGFVNGYLAADAFTKPIANLINNKLPDLLITIIITAFLTYLQVIFGEIIPKKIAMKNPEKFIYKTIRPIHLLKIISAPLVFILTKSADFIARLLNVHEVSDHITEEELRILVMGSGDAIKSEEKVMFEKILAFDDQIVSDVMTHRTEVAAIDITDDYRKIIKLIKKEQYSRYPVYSESLDNIVGIFHIKDLITANLNSETFNIKKYLRKPYYVPEVMTTDDLFKNMQSAKTHLAIVVDEFGGTSGIVTMEDILEEIVGNIFDEHDEVLVEVKDLGNETYLIDALAPIDDVEDIIKAGLPTDEYDTLGGFVLGILGRIPETNELVSFEYLGHLYEVVSYDDKLISEVRVTKLTNDEEEL